PRTVPDMPKGGPTGVWSPLERISAAEGEPVDVHEVGRLAAGERQVHVVRAGHGADVRRDRPPRLPAAGVADRETADGRVAPAVQPDLDQSADAAARTAGHPGGELPGRGRTEGHRLVQQPCTVGEGA